MRILITGSEGVLGSTLKRELRVRGHEVFGCDLAHSSDPQVKRADVSERRQVIRAFDWAQPQLVYHFAAEFGRINGQEYYEQLWRTNCIGTRNVAEECARSGAVMAFASSSESYGMADDYAPKDEGFQEKWLDTYAPQFHNEYALTKYTNERQITMAARNNDLKAVIFRFFNAYGPGEPYSPYRSVICLFTYRMLSGQPITVYKDYYRTHMFINDWVKPIANLAGAEGRDVINEIGNCRWDGSGGSGVPVFNIGGVEYESVEETANRIADIAGVRPIINFVPSEEANVISKRPDNSLAAVWLGHDPTTTLDEGIPPTVAWMKERYGL